MTRPRVTVAMPLYRSRRFLDCVTRNIEGIDDPAAEIIVSDRHQLDDALERLEARFPGDRRIRWVAARDELGWVEHYNWLLSAASADAFAWMPHDDEHAPGYVAALVAALEAEPAAILAHGWIELVGPDGRALAEQPPAGLPLAPGEPWSVRAALRRLVLCNACLVPFHGVFRRDRLLAAGLSLRAPRGGVWADTYWVFAAELLGHPVYEPRAVCTKRIHDEAISVRWGNVSLREALSGYRVLAGYIGDHAPSPAAGAQALAVVSLWTVARALATVPSPLRGRRMASAVLGRLLGARV
jgi:glycosyltransferase involved in cell wall biosynthesis